VAVTFIDDSNTQEGRCLVYSPHGVTGKAFVIAYLIKFNAMSLEDALLHMFWCFEQHELPLSWLNALGSWEMKTRGGKGTLSKVMRSAKHERTEAMELADRFVFKLKN
jgi:hypothetical protein